MRRGIIFRIAIVLGELWLIVGITLLVLVVLEVSACVGYALHDNQYNEQVTDWLLGTDIYRNQDWAAEYWHERDQPLWITYSEWHPYIYWRHAPYRGKYINIDQTGIRSTWNKSATPSPTQVKVFALGGSALWGTGARDEYTIPSLISKKLNAQNQEVWVTNFGEGGYVSTQEVITLMLKLQKGNVPDVVLFYGGANARNALLKQEGKIWVWRTECWTRIPRICRSSNRSRAITAFPLPFTGSRLSTPKKSFGLGETTSRYLWRGAILCAG